MELKVAPAPQSEVSVGGHTRPGAKGALAAGAPSFIHQTQMELQLTTWWARFCCGTGGKGKLSAPMGTDSMGREMASKYLHFYLGDEK